VIGISQSGQSPDIVSVIEEARRQGAPTIAITNDLDSPLALAAEYQIGLDVGVERSVAATKTYTAQLAALALLALSLKDAPNHLEPLDAVHVVLAQALAAEPEAIQAAHSLAEYDRTVFIGRGFNYSTAWEIALKCKELANMQAEPYSSADFLHGPIALVEAGFPVNLVSFGDTFRDELDGLGATLRQRGARLITIGDKPLVDTSKGVTCSFPSRLASRSGSARLLPSCRVSCSPTTSPYLAGPRPAAHHPKVTPPAESSQASVAN
jgi:glucosamine--fructose-6-phosphate aminotransferase (isomerizing)